MTAAEAIARATDGDGVFYDGALRPPLGEALWDPGEGQWAVRLRESDEPYPCGPDCCGYAYAVVGIPDPGLCRSDDGTISG